MTRDPILDKRRDSSGSGFIEDLAVNNTYSDMPTLVQYLKSEKVISNIARKNNLPYLALKNRINISVPRIQMYKVLHKASSNKCSRCR